MNLSYILDKIRAADFVETPFRHVEIMDLFEPDDFNAIAQSADIALAPAATDEELFENLFASNYRIIEFPGCTVDYKEYIAWHRDKPPGFGKKTSCEGFGVVVRLESPASEPVRQLKGFLNSDEFVRCLAEKFGLPADECKYDAGIQKYLDGYEISPHPDSRKKALTYMVNINPGSGSSKENHHTHYLEFKPEKRYVQEFWKGNPDEGRCWVPWDWCHSIKQQVENNSMVIFSPGDDTLHAVKADYDHLPYQRTQCYGNLWYTSTQAHGGPQWEDFVIQREKRSRNKPVLKRGIRDRIASVFRGSPDDDSSGTHVERDV